MKLNLTLLVGICLTLFLFAATLQLTYEKVGKPFKGYLSFKNQVVGAFYVPGWTGPEKGFIYHMQVPGISAVSDLDPNRPSSFFSFRDFILVVLIPAVIGLCFVFLGAGICWALSDQSGSLPLFFFHLFVGGYLILSPEFHLTYFFSYLHLALFVLIPATMIHFALLFPEKNVWIARHARFYLLPYLMSFFLGFPYLYWFESHPAAWIKIEYLVVFYVIAAYLFWLSSMGWTLRRPQLDLNRIVIRHIFFGQLIAFTVPLLATIGIFMGGVSFPLNLAAPFVLFFPLALLLGVGLGRFRRNQIQLIQIEKMATLGNLFSGLAHEINNPLTFIYSNLEPLRESIDHLRLRLLESPQSQDERTREVLEDLPSLLNTIEEGAQRAREIIGHFRSLSHPGSEMADEIDIHLLIDQSLSFLKPSWREGIQLKKDYGLIPKISGSSAALGQVFVNLISNALDAIPQRGAIEIITHLNATKIQIHVRDTGEGISPEKQSRIFDPFYTTKAQGKGTGLGLSLVLKTIRNHGGHIEVKSELGKGSEFIVELPI